MRRVLACSTAAAACATRSYSHKDLYEKPLDKQVNDKTRKGPPVAHSLPVYKTAHKLHQSARWKTANVVTNVAGGKDFRLRETHGEGRVDETGVYRDFLYGEERRLANYSVTALAAMVFALFYYTVNVMGSETWEIPQPLQQKPPDTVGKQQLLSGAKAPSIASRPATPSNIVPSTKHGTVVA
jgi:hypothetical protein